MSNAIIEFYEIFLDLIEDPLVKKVFAFSLIVSACSFVWNIISVIIDSSSKSGNVKNIEKRKSSGSESVEILDEVSSIYDAHGVMEMEKELRKNDVVKMVSVSQSSDNFLSRDIPHRCPYCWGRPDDSGICQYCGSRLV